MTKINRKFNVIWAFSNVAEQAIDKEVYKKVERVDYKKALIAGGFNAMASVAGFGVGSLYKAAVPQGSMSKIAYKAHERVTVGGPYGLIFSSLYSTSMTAIEQIKGE